MVEISVLAHKGFSISAYPEQQPGNRFSLRFSIQKENADGEFVYVKDVSDELYDTHQMAVLRSFEVAKLWIDCKYNLRDI